MALPIKYPFIKVGDSGNQLEDFRLTGFVDANTDRGTLYVSITTSGSNAIVKFYSDMDRTVEVGTGTGPALSTITITPVGAESLAGSVYLKELGDNEIIELVVSLVTEDDMNDAIDRVGELRLEEEPELDEFLVIQRKVMRAFYIKMQAIFPPATGLDNPLRLYQQGNAKTPGKIGEVEIYARYLWGLNRRRRFELVGLQNPSDYKDWAITEAMWRLWDRRVEGGELDEQFQRVEELRKRAKMEFKEITPWIDVDSDGNPDRPALTSSIRIERG